MYEEKILFAGHRQHCAAGEAEGQALTWTFSLQNRLKIQLWWRHMALQMGADNLPGYLPPGTAPFHKCWKETSEVPSCRLCDRGMRAAVMLLCPLFVSLCAPGWGTRNCKGGQDIWFSTWIILESQAPVWFWLLFCLMIWDLTKSMGVLYTLEGKISCRYSCRHPKSSVSCTKGWHGTMQQIAALPTENRSESWRAVFKQISIASLMDEHPQLKLFNLNNKVETKQQKPSPVLMQNMHCVPSSSLQKQRSRPSFGTVHQSHVGDTFPQPGGWDLQALLLIWQLLDPCFVLHVWECL